MKKVLILSCSTGQGHNSCAAAITEYWTARGVPCDTRDALAFVAPWVSRFLCWGHRTMYRYIPALFRWGYRNAEQHPGMFEGSAPSRWLLRRGAENLAQAIQDGGYDTVICTHIFAAIMLTDALAAHPMNVTTACLTTDYTWTPGIRATDLQHCFIPHRSLEHPFTINGVPRKRIAVTGIPVQKSFQKTVEKEDAKRLLNLRPDHKHLLVSCGSMGCGPIRRVMKHLAKNLPENVEVTVVCGTNKHLARCLKRTYRKLPAIHILDYTNQMPLYMDASDLYLTKPGGITVTEATVKHLPMVLINAVSGCEEYNLRFFTTRKAAVTARTPAELAQTCLDLLKNDEALRKMRIVMRDQIKVGGAERIWNELGGGSEV